MKKIIIGLLILGSSACNNSPVSNPSSSPSNQIANPASVNCDKAGGKVDIRNTAAGQVGICVFPDKSECDEWELYRGTCRQGQIKP